MPLILTCQATQLTTTQTPDSPCEPSVPRRVGALAISGNTGFCPDLKRPQQLVVVNTKSLSCTRPAPKAVTEYLSIENDCGDHLSNSPCSFVDCIVLQSLRRKALTLHAVNTLFSFGMFRAGFIGENTSNHMSWPKNTPKTSMGRPKATRSRASGAWTHLRHTVGAKVWHSSRNGHPRS